MGTDRQDRMIAGFITTPSFRDPQENFVDARLWLSEDGLVSLETIRGAAKRETGVEPLSETVIFDQGDGKGVAAAFSALISDAARIAYNGPKPDTNQPWRGLHAFHVLLPNNHSEREPGASAIRVRIGYRRRDNQPGDLPWISQLLQWRGGTDFDMRALPAQASSSAKAAESLIEFITPQLEALIDGLVLANSASIKP